MTIDTTFKEFVEEEGIKLSLLEVGSAEYWNLIEAFNRTKIELRAKAENLEYAGARERRCFWVVGYNR